MVLALLSARLGLAQVPTTISYQGMLVEEPGTPVADGSYDVIFRLYTDADPSTPLWSEMQSVQVTNGVFSVLLGNVSILDLPFDVPYYLGITIGETSELSPRIPLATSPYSIRAKSIEDGQVVRSINELKDNVLLEAGANISIAEEDNKIIISTSGSNGGGGITQIITGESFLQSKRSLRYDGYCLDRCRCKLLSNNILTGMSWLILSQPEEL
jgi:hypothetical protein